MNNELTDKELSNWFSTYGMITAERILERYFIKLPSLDLHAAIKNSGSFYHHLLKVPLKNVLNGIILQQANDYHVYAQKLFIDYLLSGETNKDEEAQGAATRDALENERQKLLTLGDEFNELQEKHGEVIAFSQKTLIQITKSLNEEQQTVITELAALFNEAGYKEKKNKMKQAIMHALIYCDRTAADSGGTVFAETINEFMKTSLSVELKERLSTILEPMLTLIDRFYDDADKYMEQAQDITLSSNSFRSQFFSAILRVIGLIKLLPDYKIDPVQDEINREPLYFDKNIGSIGID